MKILHHTRAQWMEVEQASHNEVFEGRYQLPKNSQYHTAVVAATDEGSIIGYALVADCLSGYYLEYGGATSHFKNSPQVLPALKMIIDYIRSSKIPFITTHVSNTNQKMLRLYLKLGFLITGTSMWNGSTMVELTFDNILKGEE